ncbi:MAG: proton-conducting transporter membrane subunit [Anaeromyxobacteraceae bacterium]
MLPLLVTLLLVPLAASAALLFTTRPARRTAVVLAACVTVAAATLAVAVEFAGTGPAFLAAPVELPPHLVLAVEAALALLVVGLGLRHRRPLAPALAVAQFGIGAWLEWTGHPEAVEGRALRVDHLSVVMIAIVGILGTLICVHALGYMRDYHRQHPQVAGRRTSFFFLLFVFVSAMFGLVVANELPHLYLFWEVTTLCSFLLIGYTRTEETIGYAFRALELNLLGGLGFAVAILLLARIPGGLDVATLASGALGPAAVPALGLLALAGLTKSAQLPFSSWLLGAMYAPTPTSALLHSSTMVKAGVFLLIRLAPAMAGTVVGGGVATVGLLTFLTASLVAVGEQNAKKVLACSTLANLGLIVACAGLANAVALWAAVMLVIFHAVAKSLLFLVVGTLENRFYTKDLENLDHLVSRLPRVAVLALTGIAGMFIAPFGVVIAKWTAIRAFLMLPGWAGAVALLVLSFGSGCTLYYWAKLLLKVLATRAIPEPERAIEARVSGFEWFAETTHAALVLGLAGGVGVLSSAVVSPWVQAALPGGEGPLLALDPWMAPALVVATAFLPLAAWRLTVRPTHDLGGIYVSGRTVSASHTVSSPRGGARELSTRNFYLRGLLDGGRVFRAGAALGAVVVAATLLLGAVVKP